MCGIVGYIGDNMAKEVILEGLEKLEYRGYDSAGISVFNLQLSTIKTKGRIASLKEQVGNKLVGNIGIGHTRWATHGEPSVVNAHPHVNEKETISVVHNGIIENYLDLKKELMKDGYTFKSETDTEVIVHLIDKNYKGNLLEAVKKSIKKLKGTYAICVISSLEPDKLIVARKESPLIIGIGSNEMLISSDVTALLKYTKKVKYLEDGDIACIRKQEVIIYDENLKIKNIETKTIEWDLESATKSGYPHFMIKEIMEEPHALYETIKRRLDKNNIIKLDNIKLSERFIKEIDSINIVACGTAYHAGLIGKNFLENILNIPVNVSIASEFRYRKNFITNKTLTIIISQSGETLDTLVSLKEAKEKGSRVLAITNVVGSSIAREADDVFYTWAGPEIAVASTKAYTTQIMSLYMIGLDMARRIKKIDDERYKDYIVKLLEVPNKVKEILNDISGIKKDVKLMKNINNAFYLGRVVDYYLACEGSLKLKEISYIHSEALASGELKHGTIALIEEGTICIFLATQSDLYEKTLSNIKEVKARGANTIVLTKKGNKIFEDVSDEIIYLPKMDDEIIAIYAIIPLQLIAYYVSVERGIDVDKPRNLAKSVTVE